MTWQTSLVAATLACLLSTVCGGGRLELRLLRYDNDDGKDADGQCCESIFTFACGSNECDTLLDICIQDTSGSGCPIGHVTTAAVDNSDHIQFGNNLGNGVTNPIIFPFSTWGGSVVLKITVSDEDSDSNDKIDYLQYLLAPSTVDVNGRRQTVLKRTLRGTRTKLEVEMNVRCDPEFYGRDCSVRCVPVMYKYSCNSAGGKVCVAGWEGANCDVNVDDCLQHRCQNGATCQDHLNGYGCVCPPRFTGYNCEVAMTTPTTPSTTTPTPTTTSPSTTLPSSTTTTTTPTTATVAMTTTQATTTALSDTPNNVGGFTLPLVGTSTSSGYTSTNVTNTMATATTTWPSEQCRMDITSIKAGRVIAEIQGDFNNVTFKQYLTQALLQGTGYSSADLFLNTTQVVHSSTARTLYVNGFDIRKARVLNTGLLANLSKVYCKGLPPPSPTTKAVTTTTTAGYTTTNATVSLTTTSIMTSTTSSNDKSTMTSTTSSTMSTVTSTMSTKTTTTPPKTSTMTTTTPTKTTTMSTTTVTLPSQQCHINVTLMKAGQLVLEVVGDFSRDLFELYLTQSLAKKTGSNRTQLVLNTTQVVHTNTSRTVRVSGWFDLNMTTAINTELLANLSTRYCRTSPNSFASHQGRGNGGSGGSSVPLVGGGVAAVLVLGAACILAVFLIKRKKRRSGRIEHFDDGPSTKTETTVAPASDPMETKRPPLTNNGANPSPTPKHMTTNVAHAEPPAPVPPVMMVAPLHPDLGEPSPPPVKTDNVFKASPPQISAVEEPATGLIPVEELKPDIQEPPTTVPPEETVLPETRPTDAVSDLAEEEILPKTETTPTPVTTEEIPPGTPVIQEEPVTQQEVATVPQTEDTPPGPQEGDLSQIDIQPEPEGLGDVPQEGTQQPSGTQEDPVPADDVTNPPQSDGPEGLLEDRGDDPINPATPPSDLNSPHKEGGDITLNMV